MTGKYRWIATVILFTLLCLILEPFCVWAWEAATGIDWLTDTPDANVFRVEGSEREFILLDITDDPDSKYFVLAKEFYAARPFDSSGKTLFDPNDGRNMGGWLNNSFLKYGSQVFTGETLKFPDGIIEHIDMEHEWITDGVPAPTKELGTYGVGLISQEEMVRYADKFGVDDGLTTSLLFDARGWWIRSQPDTNTTGKIAFRYDQDTATGTNIHAWGATSPSSIVVRPCFYLDESFFSSVRLNMNDMGEEVLSLFRRYYLKEQLTGIYTPEELQDIFGYKADVRLDVTGWTDADGNEVAQLKTADYVTAKVTAKSSMPGENEAALTMVLYGEDKCPISFAVERIKLHYGVEETYQIGMLLRPGQKEDGAYLKVYLLKSGAKLQTISNAVRAYLK